MSIDPGTDSSLSRTETGYRSKHKRFLIVEYALCAGIVSCLVRAVLYYRERGFFPPPIFFDYFDSLMDGFNTVAWSYFPGTYDIWRSIYPPISFVFGRIFSDPRCYGGTVGYARDCDSIFKIALAVFFLINIVLVFIAYARNDRSSALPRTIAVTLGAPILFAAERGNLIIPAFTCFIIGYAPIFTSVRISWVAAAMSANFKPYLVPSLLAPLIRRRWRWVEGAVLATIFVYFITYALFGSGSPIEIFKNTVTFSDPVRSADWTVVHYASSYIALGGFMEISPFPVTRIVGSDVVEFFQWYLPTIMWSSRLLTILAAGAIFLRPGAVPRHRSVALVTLFAVTGQETGGYALCFPLFLLFFERADRFLICFAIFLGYLVSIFADIEIAQLWYSANAESYFAGRPVTASYQLSLGSFLRPTLYLIIMDLMAISSILSVVSVLRKDRSDSVNGPASRELEAST